MMPCVQYVTTPDGVRIAYATFGEGDGVPLVALRPSAMSHVEAEWRLARPLGLRAFERLAHGRRVVRLDVRGCGLSDRDVTDRSGRNGAGRDVMNGGRMYVSMPRRDQSAGRDGR